MTTLVEARVSRRNLRRLLAMIRPWTPHRPKSPKLADRFEPSTSRRSVGASLRSRRATSRRPIRRSTRRALFDARPAAAGSIRRVSGASSATCPEHRAEVRLARRGFGLAFGLPASLCVDTLFTDRFRLQLAALSPTSVGRFAPLGVGLGRDPFPLGLPRLATFVAVIPDEIPLILHQIAALAVQAPDVGPRVALEGLRFGLDARRVAPGFIRPASAASSATSIEIRPSEAPPPAFPPPCPMLRSPRATTRHRAPGGVSFDAPRARGPFDGHLTRSRPRRSARPISAKIGPSPPSRNRRFAPRQLGSSGQIFRVE